MAEKHFLDKINIVLRSVVLVHFRKTIFKM
jgi:hypothetical protein